MPLRLLKRLQSSAPRDIVERAIRECIVESRINPGKFKFGENLQHDFDIIRAASKAANRAVPDQAIGTFKTASDLVKYLCKEMPLPLIRGIPKLELFHNIDLPPNVRLINYRKKKWSDQEFRGRIRAALKEAGILD